MTSRDPFDILTEAAARDRSWREPVDLDHDSAAAAVLRRVLDGSVVIPIERGRRRRRLLAGGLVIGIVATGSAVAATSWTRQAPSTVRALACWNEAPLGDEGVIIGTRFGDEDPVDTCADMWARPEMAEYGVTGDLVTCVADYGTAVVIPGPDETACDEAGLSRFDGRIAPDVLAIRDVEDEYVARIIDGECLDAAEAVAVVDESLDRHGLDDWTIVVNEDRPFTDEDCAALAFDEETSTAHVVAIPRMHEPAGGADGS